MELIPTIVTALEIAAVLTIITLVLSYAALKMKQKRENSEGELTPELNPVKHQVQQAPTPSQKQVQQKDPRNDRPDSKHEKSPSQPGNSSHKKESKPEKKEEPFRNKRLEVIDNLGHTNSTAAKIIKSENGQKRSTNLNSLGDNVIDKYDNAKSDSMFSLKADEKKKKKD